MRIIKNSIAFILIFTILAVGVVCAAVVVDNSGSNGLSEVSAAYTPRLSAPAKTNKYYYSDINVFYKYGYGMPNCTCYAYGRAYEILGKKPDLCIYDADEWYDYNKDNKIYSYGKTPKLGAIACWRYSNYDSGHVAVVEKISGDTITFSNSAYSGASFYTNTASVSDPSNNNKTWIFQGYIYIGDFSSGETEPTPTEVQGDIYKITSDNGVNIRSGAGTSYTVVGAIPQNQSVTVSTTKKNESYTWGYTTYNGVSGWFVTEFAQLVFPNTQSTESTQPTANATEPPTENTVLMGDADDDGEITVLDATVFQRILASAITPTQHQLLVADYDGDGFFTILDATKIQRTLARM